MKVQEGERLSGSVAGGRSHKDEQDLLQYHLGQLKKFFR